MKRPALEVADIVRQHRVGFLEEHGASLSSNQKRVLTDIEQCRTAALGGHLERCDHCGHERPAYNSCRNRHCPKCQALARAKWLEAREAELLPVPYFHVVFTIPHTFNGLALQNKKVFYGILFRAASQTLLQVASDPQHLGAEIGVLAVLHSWGQKLDAHPHLHCVIPGGGLRKEGDQQFRWINCKVSKKSKKKFFLPVKVLSPVFRGKFVHGLRRAYEKGELSFSGKQREWATAEKFEELLNVSVQKKWTVYAKRPFSRPDRVLKYLARYTHRVAISNHRLIDMEEDHVRFSYKDYSQNGEQKVLRLHVFEFLRRFLLHVLPNDFTRIRYYGFLCNRYRRCKLAIARRLLEELARTIPCAVSADLSMVMFEAPPCPCCKEGRMRLVGIISPCRTAPRDANQQAIPPPEA